MMITLATGNAHKLQEFQDILGLPVRGLRDIPGAPEPEETGSTFAENAMIKAESLAAFCGGWALADDSGLEVHALQGAPGIYSARYAGRHGDDAANNALLLRNLEKVTDRSARFVCVLALCGPSGECTVIEGECRGRIAQAPAGSDGFGYDPLFIPEGESQTCAQLGAAWKSRHSHRAHALSQFLAQHAALLDKLRSA